MQHGYIIKCYIVLCLLLTRWKTTNSRCLVFYQRDFTIGDFPNDNIPSGNFPNVQFPKGQLPKG